MRWLQYLSLSALLWASPLYADPTPEDYKKAEIYFNQAESLYKIGSYKKALENYNQAYLLASLPDLLYNMAQCHRQLEHYSDAIELYEKYLRDVPDSPQKLQVEETIDELRKLEEQQTLKDKAIRVVSQNKLPFVFAGVWVGTGGVASIIHKAIVVREQASHGFYNTGQIFALTSDAAFIALGVTTYLSIKSQRESVVSLAPISGGALLSFSFTPEVGQ